MTLRDFHDLRDRIYDVYSDGRYRDGLALLDGAEHAFPHREATVVFWRACFLSLTGRPHEGLESLRSGLDRGLWWSEFAVREDPDLGAVRDLPGYEEFAAESLRRADEFARTYRPPPPVVMAPNGAPRALLVALHGGGGTATGFAAYWERGVEAGALVAVPQSPRPFTSDGEEFMWRESAFEGDLEAILGELRARPGAAPLPLVLAGYSQGGRLALRTALAGPLERPAGVIAAAARVDGELAALLERIRQPGPRDTRFWLLVGDRDFARPGMEAIHAALVEAKFRSALTVVAGLDHSMPEDFRERLPEALAFVLNNDAR